MNHWVSKYSLDRSKCSACGEAIDNASEEGAVLITGDCKGAPALERGRMIACHGCMAAIPFDGRYELVDLEDTPHAAFCEKCGKFVGDGCYVVSMPTQQKNLAGRVTSAPLFGIWCEPPPSDLPHTCIETVSPEMGLRPCVACADRFALYGVARFAQHPGAVTEFPWAFGTDEAAQLTINEDPPMGPEWAYEVRPLTGSK